MERELIKAEVERLFDQLNLKPSNKEAFQTYYNSISVIVTSDWVTSNCADIMFLNNAPLVGGGTFLVNGFVMPPGQFISFSANEKELDTTQYRVNFTPGSGSFQCYIFRKYYNFK